MTCDSTLNPAAVEVGRFYPHAPSDVWRAIADPTVVKLWLMAATGFVASVGTRFVLAMPSQFPSVGRWHAAPAGAMRCEVLAARPDEQLTLSLVDLRPEQHARWLVDWAIRPQGRGTRLLLTHSGFDIEDRRQKMVRNAMERMWHSRLSALRDVLDLGHQNLI